MAKDIELFRVTDQLPRTTITMAGETMEQMEVFFETKSGIKDSILIPKEDYTKEKALSRVREAAETIEAVQELKE